MRQNKTQKPKIIHRKKSLHASVSPYILEEMDKHVISEKFTSRSDFASVACSQLLERLTVNENVE